jgi:hypothetical protein
MARILQPRQEKGGASRREAIETTGEVFSDGTTLELIRLDPGAGETSLLRWDGKSATIGQQFEVNDKVYRAPQMNSTSLRALRLPGHIASYGSTRGLFDDICKVFTQCTDIAEEHVWLIAYFGLANWLADRLLVAPFLFVIASLGTPRSQLLRLLSCLCRHPLMLVEVTPAALSSLASLRPTFLFDEPNLSRRAERFLYATNNHSHTFLRNDRIVDVFSPKVICSREPLRDASLASQALQITLNPAGRQVPFLEDSVCERIADEFQSKLLQYRLTNLRRIRTPEIDVSELTVPMQDVARAFASCVADDEELQLGVVQLLRERDQDIYLDPSTELESVILEGLLFCCHNNGRPQVLSGELADIVNTIWEKRGEGRQTTPESVGWKLRALDLRTEPIDGTGKGLRLTEAVRARIHSLAQAYRVPSLRQAAPLTCPHCKVGFEKK